MHKLCRVGIGQGWLVLAGCGGDFVRSRKEALACSSGLTTVPRSLAAPSPGALSIEWFHGGFMVVSRWLQGRNISPLRGAREPTNLS